MGRVINSRYDCLFYDGKNGQQFKISARFLWHVTILGSAFKAFIKTTGYYVIALQFYYLAGY